MEHGDPHLHHLVGKVYFNNQGCLSDDTSPSIWRVECHKGWAYREDDQRKMKFLVIAMVAHWGVYICIVSRLFRWRGRQPVRLCSRDVFSLLAILVCPSEWTPEDDLNQFDFQLAIKIDKGSKFALAILYLGECVQNIKKSADATGGDSHGFQLPPNVSMSEFHLTGSEASWICKRSLRDGDVCRHWKIKKTYSIYKLVLGDG